MKMITRIVQLPVMQFGRLELNRCIDKF